MALVGALNIGLNANIGKFVRNMTTARGMLKTFRKTAISTAAVMARLAAAPLRMGWNMLSSVIGGIVRKLKSLIKYAALAAVAMPAIGVKLAAGFEKQMAMVSTMLTGNDMGFMEGFGKGVRGLSKEFGQSTATLSRYLCDILSASIAAGDAMEVLRVSTQAAVGGITQTEIAADAITTVINSYKNMGMSAKDAMTISDQLFATVKRGKLTYEELASNIGQVSSIASIAGMSLSELLAGIATVTRAGQKSEVAMTGLRATLTTFISPTEGARKAAKKFGVTLSAAALQEKGLIGATKQLANLNADQLGGIIENVRAFKAFAAVINDVKGFEEDLAFISQSSAGAAAEAFGKMAGTTAFKLSQLKQTAGDVLTGLGLALLPVVTTISEALLPKFNELGEWFTDNKESVTAWAMWIYDWITYLGAKFGGFVTGFYTDFDGMVGNIVSFANVAFAAIANLAGIWGPQITKKLLGSVFYDLLAGSERAVYKGLHATSSGVTKVATLGSDVGQKRIEDSRHRVLRQIDSDQRNWRTKGLGNFGSAPEQSEVLLKQVISELKQINNKSGPNTVGDVGGAY